MQNPLRVVARILTGTTYVVLGADAVLAPAKRPALPPPTPAPIRRVVPRPGEEEVNHHRHAAAVPPGGGSGRGGHDGSSASSHTRGPKPGGRPWPGDRP